ncbi:MAG: S8 family serine peptidase [Paludibacteraceae bacterium]|nr:S8 family serine peptidase [Paludibacteraceae bacterium]
MSVCYAVRANTWFVGFRDKNGTTGKIDNPSEYLSERALERRQAQGISIDSTDLPVSRIYTDSLKALGVRILYTIKWLNGAVITADTSFNADVILKLEFVNMVQLTKRDNIPISAAARRKLHEENSSVSLMPATEAIREYENMLHLDSLHKLGFHGQGKMISILDNGFALADKLPWFVHSRKNVAATFDIVKPDGNVYDSGTHGAMVFSVISGVKEDTIIGTASEASYCLFHTEDDTSESLLEPDNMVRAFEIADSIGTDIITSSLGYNLFDDSLSNFTYQDMDGKTARCSRAATIAADKGILVCIAAGNEANKPWHYICAPADAEEILTVGGVDLNLQHSTFSSAGPSVDGRIKPDVCALGTGVPIYYDGFKRSNGTSFATPIIAGAAASLWSALPELTVKQLRERIIHYSDRYKNPDNEYGYGIPNLIAAYYDTPTGITYTTTDENKSIAIYNINGNYLGGDTNVLPKGIYIVRQNGEVRKIVKIEK